MDNMLNLVADALQQQKTTSCFTPVSQDHISEDTVGTVIQFSKVGQLKIYLPGLFPVFNSPGESGPTTGCAIFFPFITMDLIIHCRPFKTWIFL